FLAKYPQLNVVYRFFGDAISFMTRPVKKAMAVGALENVFIALQLYEFLRRYVHVAYLANAVLHRRNCNPCLFEEEKIGFLQEIGVYPIPHELPNYFQTIQPALQLSALLKEDGFFLFHLTAPFGQFLFQFGYFDPKTLDVVHQLQEAVFTPGNLLFSFIGLFEDRLVFLICLHFALAGFLPPHARTEILYLLFDRTVHFLCIVVLFLFRKILSFERFQFSFQLGNAAWGFLTASDQLVLFVFDLLVLNQTFKLIKQFTTSW